MQNTIADLCEAMPPDDKVWLVFAVAETGEAYVIVIDGHQRQPISHQMAIHLPINLQDAGHRALENGVQWMDDDHAYMHQHIYKSSPLAIVQYLGVDA